MKQPMNVSAWNMRPSAHIMLTLTNRSDAPWNEAMWKNERFDKLLDMAAGELDDAKRNEMLGEAQGLCAAESGSLIPTHAAYLDAIASNLKGFPRVPIAAFGGMEWPEFIWLDT